ncbi:MAG: beta-lactamase family protein, partial [Actinobacteria bacterium]|nr:beta-lactamase family protein [Actinomycetota bacterium]
MPTAAHVAPGMEPVAEAFERMLADGREPGGEVAVFRDGEPLLITRGGTMDASGRPWQPDTLVQVFSTGKAIAAAAALAAVADGTLRLDDPLTDHWPEYRDDPAQPTTLRRLLSHRAGKFAFPDETADEHPFDQQALIASLAAAVPEFPEGLGSVEHATTYGHLINGVLHSVGAPSVARTATELGELVGATFYFGVPDAEQDRVADLELIDAGWVDPYLGSDAAKRALTRPRDVLDPAALNRPEWRSTGFPAVGLHT